MEIRVDKENIISTDKTNKIKNDVTSFSSILSRKKEESDELKKQELSELYDKSSNIKALGSLLNIDMKENKERFTKENGKVNIKDILNQYEGKFDTRELNKLLQVVNSLYKEGLIDSADYYEVLRWIERKIFEKSMEVKIENMKYKVAESLDKE